EARVIVDAPAGTIEASNVIIPTSTRELPEKVPTFLPTIVMSFFGVKRDPGSGSGEGGGSRTVPIQKPEDKNSNWFPFRSGSRTNLRSVTINFDKPLPYVQLFYRGLYPQ